MKNVFPIVMTPAKAGYVVYIPDFHINTEGDTLTEAMEMARDAIGIMGIDMQDDGKALPSPSALEDVKGENENDVITLVDVDFTEYRRKNDLRAVKKNCTVPAWLAYEAEKAGLNFSATLQTALKNELGIVGR